MQHTQVKVEDHYDHQTTRNFNYHTTGDIDTYTGEGGFAGGEEKKSVHLHSHTAFLPSTSSQANHQA